MIVIWGRRISIRSADENYLGFGDVKLVRLCKRKSLPRLREGKNILLFKGYMMKSSRFQTTLKFFLMVSSNVKNKL